MAKKNLTLATLVAASMLASASAQASEKELLDVLLENGVISKGQHTALEKKFIKKSGTKVSTKGGIKAKSADGDFSFKFGGRVQVDAGYVDEDKDSGFDHNSGTEFRRLRLFAKGKLHQDWGYKVQIDFADEGVSVKDAYIKNLPYGVTIGNFKQPIGLEELTSSKYITFLERSQPSVFNTSHRIGLGIKRGGKNWSLAGSVYGGTAADNEDGQEGYGFGARGTFAPVAEKTRAFHLGAALAREEPNDDGDDVRFRQRPEFHVTNRFLNTGSITNVDNIQRYGLEAATVLGPFSLQGEYTKVTVERDNNLDDLDFDGSYITASYFLTGESRPYSAKKGAFGRVKPKSKSGAWEVAARFSTLDLDDAEIQGGDADNITLGLNWYINPNVRISANYIDVDAEKAGVDDDPNIFAVRTQIDF